MITFYYAMLFNLLPFSTLCDCILTSEKLIYKNADYWIECFNLIRRIIGGVDYKGVREIMKVELYIYFQFTVNADFFLSFILPKCIRVSNII